VEGIMEIYADRDHRERFRKFLDRNQRLVSHDSQAYQLLYLISMCRDQDFPFQDFLSDFSVDLNGIIARIRNEQDQWLFSYSLYYINYSRSLRITTFPVLVIVDEGNDLDEYYKDAFNLFVYWTMMFLANQITYPTTKEPS
jgi:hypothetical protein